MNPENAQVVDGRKLLLSGLFAACFIGVAAFAILPITVVAIFVGLMIGFPTGIAASFAKTSWGAAAWIAGFWGIVSGSVQIVILAFAKADGSTAKICATHLALVLSVAFIAGLCGGCSQIFCRAIPSRNEPRQPFQYSIFEALMLSVMFAVCLGCGVWLERQASDVIGHYTASWFGPPPIAK